MIWLIYRYINIHMCIDSYFSDWDSVMFPEVYWYEIYGILSASWKTIHDDLPKQVLSRRNESSGADVFFFPCLNFRWGSWMVTSINIKVPNISNTSNSLKISMALRLRSYQLIRLIPWNLSLVTIDKLEHPAGTFGKNKAKKWNRYG